ncbi:FadR family transcriptional regulator [Pseudomonas putida]|uniref:FadR/GntR family transcriptional regulator n=1 Tax=Pseudomonas putida TaxID=303 RepID=UPI0023633197|nr:FadR/GntR family transcriptional regulator [Pseudomonas putida]MDD1963794.1 FadR family transcriptional regulator [Pseudomonas putida]
MEATANARRGNLAETVIRELSNRIDTGAYRPGEKLPSELALGKEFNVSRPVIREAVASLRLGGRLVARQGIGVFVVEQDTKRIGYALSTPAGDVRAAAQVLELRLGVELESVARAAQRRSPTSIAEVTEAFDRFNALDGSDLEAEVKADFDFHMAIARATNNPHFTQFMEALGPEIISDLQIKHSRASKKNRKSHIEKIEKEHAAILTAIMIGDVDAARAALRKHLDESLLRYQRLVGSDQ